MFWGLILEPYKRYTQCVEQAFHLSMACLDVSQAHSESIQVMLKYNDRNFLLCTLNKNTVFQTPLDVLFEKGDNITFYCNGRGSVHMTGYLLPNDLLDSDSDSEIKEEQKGEEIELNTIPEKSLKRKAESPKIKKKAKFIKQKYFEGNNWDDEDDDDDDEEEENNSSLEIDSDDDTDIEDEEDEIDNDDDDVEEEEEEEEEQQQQQQQEEEQEHEHKHKHKHEKIAKPQKHEKKELEDQQQNKQKKKHDKQNKINGEEVKQEQQSKKQKKKAEQQTQKNNLIEAKKRIIEGGVQVEDIKLGNGALATSGKLVTVYYVGRCKIGKEERKVDSYTQGNGFKFRLGKGEVIKGWDVGISGMKVGGKRRLTIPPNMGYGAKGSLPTIPANSTLVFEIELKNVN